MGEPVFALILSPTVGDYKILERYNSSEEMTRALQQMLLKANKAGLTIHEAGFKHARFVLSSSKSKYQTPASWIFQNGEWMPAKSGEDMLFVLICQNGKITELKNLYVWDFVSDTLLTHTLHECTSTMCTCAAKAFGSPQVYDAFSRTPARGCLFAYKYHEILCRNGEMMPLARATEPSLILGSRAIHKPTARTGHYFYRDSYQWISAFCDLWDLFRKSNSTVITSKSIGICKPYVVQCRVKLGLNWIAHPQRKLHWYVDRHIEVSKDGRQLPRLMVAPTDLTGIELFNGGFFTLAMLDDIFVYNEPQKIIDPDAYNRVIRGDHTDKYAALLDYALEQHGG